MKLPGESNLENLTEIILNNAGSHNSIYRGKDITELFYNGTLSKQIAAGTFDDIFVGDYIIGKTSGEKYLVADLDYCLYSGDTPLTTHHALLISEGRLGTGKMNDTDVTTGAYLKSKMYTTYLTPVKTIIKNDFGTDHILTRRTLLPNAVSNNYESAGQWVDSDVDLMNERMVYGSDIFHNYLHGTAEAHNYTPDTSQLSLFKHRIDLKILLDNNGAPNWYWLRDVASNSKFCYASNRGNSNVLNASTAGYIRPAFLIY